jgi:hypothetical protein
MALLDRLNRTYSVEVSQPKEQIIDILKQRIDDAKEDTSWFSVPTIEYKKMRIDSFRMIIERTRSAFSIFGGNGFIVVHFNEVDQDRTEIIADVKPYKIGVWLTIGFLTPFSAIVIWLTHSSSIYYLLIAAWIVIAGVNYTAMVLFRYGAKGYLKSIFADISINEDLKKIK